MVVPATEVEGGAAAMRLVLRGWRRPARAYFRECDSLPERVGRKAPSLNPRTSRPAPRCAAHPGCSPTDTTHPLHPTRTIPAPTRFNGCSALPERVGRE